MKNYNNSYEERQYFYFNLSLKPQIIPKKWPLFLLWLKGKTQLKIPIYGAKYDFEDEKYAKMVRYITIYTFSGRIKKAYRLISHNGVLTQEVRIALD